MSSSGTNGIRELEFHPVTADRWPDFEELFGERGACGGCWCMWWRMARAGFEKKKGAKNRELMRKIIESGEVPGILAYADRTPAGWCSVAPRETFSALERSRILKRVDNRPVWSVVCFFVAKPFRRQGLTIKLLNAAVDYSKASGATIIEGYPVEPKKDKVADVFVYTGLASAFLQAGFVEVARRSETRPIMRYFMRDS